MPTARHDIVFQSGSNTPVGAISAAGHIVAGRGMEPGARRTFGAYALVYALAGEAAYWDEIIGSRAIRAGDLFVVFPDIPHRYGAVDGRTWDEFFVVFNGPMFDCWRSQGLISPERSWWHLTPIDYWLGRLRGCIDTQGRLGIHGAFQQVCQLQQVLADILAHAPSPSGATPHHPSWLAEACTLLADPAQRDLDLAGVARRIGVPLDTLRRTFTATMGLPPATWRRTRLIDEACRRLAGGAVTGRQLAEDLGFADEYHFSKTFRRVTGSTLSQFRARLAMSD